MSVFSCLNMYDWPSQKAANLEFWAWFSQACQAQGLGAPKTLDQGREGFEAWLDPNLFFAQTCGYPLYSKLKDQVAVIATPAYDVPGCCQHRYRSAFLARKDNAIATKQDLQSKRAAVTSPHSMSGYIFMAHHMGKAGFFSELIWTSGHAGSIAALARNKADVAAVDCVSWYWAQHDLAAEAAELEVLFWSDPVPGLPLITAKANADLVPIFQEILATCPSELTEPLRISHFIPTKLSDYDDLGTFQNQLIV